MGALEDIASALNQHLLGLALKRGPRCTVEDLDAADVLEAQTAMLAGYRVRQELEDAEDAPTGRWQRPAPSESQTMPAARGLWEDETPQRPPASVRVPRDAWPWSS